VWSLVVLLLSCVCECDQFFFYRFTSAEIFDRCEVRRVVLRVVVRGVVLDVCCVVLFLSCVCVPTRQSACKARP